MSLAWVRCAILASLLLSTASNATADEPLKICGGIAGMSCGATEYCDFPNNHCGATDQTGFCMPKPEACTREYLPCLLYTSPSPRD